jgi:quercetin dioxygenase-like cupin family protein
MSSNSVIRWTALHSFPMTLEVIRTLHGAPSRSRVSLYRYSPGQEVSGRSRAGRLYVLSGKCLVRNDEEENDLVEGDVMDFAEGGYHLKADDEGGATCVWAWELPESFRIKVNPGQQ